MVKKWNWRSDNEWDFEEPCKLTPALKRKTAVGMLTESDSQAQTPPLVYVITPFCKAKSQKLK